MRTLFSKVLAALFVLSLAAASHAAELPRLKVGYIFTTNHTPLMAAMDMGEKLTVNGMWLQPVVPKEKYQLMKDGKPVAVLDIVVIKSGSETATLFAQKQLDIGLASITAIMAGIDKRIPIKIVSPLVLASGGVVVSNAVPAKTWPEFAAYIKSSSKPVSIGYHSPSSAPIIILESALKAEGISYTSNPLDQKAQVVLVDLKGMSNLIPALSSKQVDAVVGPEPFPQTAAGKGAGCDIGMLRDLPPAGQWSDYPCCVIAARDEIIAEHPAILRDFVSLMAGVGQWCNEDAQRAGIVGSKWIGLPEKIGKNSNLRFLQSFTDGWKEGANGYLGELNKAGYFKGALKDKSFGEVENILVDPQFLNGK
ncbi:MAG: ABC transporter substrate-binding protein [Desulfovibrio desulfuricans]|uniref:ABC-type nitrate/sulfonate/bicarbonate transport systems, periplasmic components n=1 Tax=Desulfovibrio desulfuricans (strain ATCC 27774 / DSM 6949 / MB) TaxID=525146 RepID=B8IY88_DESDA|nr:ABC transporter substrate-binding protein [Desulfovibrio desulfuricans]